MELTRIALPLELVAKIPDARPEIWVRGDPEVFLRYVQGSALAVVGARSCSSYGRAIARSWSRDLAARGYAIVSGLARGVDAEAHRGALDAGGVTIAVLGCGIDRDYPAAHTELAHKIVEGGGCIISEYEPGIEPAPWRFPARNRIIAGISSACLVVEAREQSGSLITADFALEMSVPVFAVPGEVTSLLSAGTNRLIRDECAAPALEPEDVAKAMPDYVHDASSIEADPMAAQRKGL